MTTDGFSALFDAALLASDAIGFHPFADHSRFTNKLSELKQGVPGKNERPAVAHQAVDAHSVLGFASGMALTGNRTTAFTNSSGLLSLHRSLHSLAGKRIPLVLCVGCEAPEKQGPVALDGHASYHAVADSGTFQLFAQNIQQAVDFLLIAHRVAELTLTPGIVAFDQHATGESAQSVILPGNNLIESFLGHSSDHFNAPTPAQEVLFNGQRRRVPELYSLDHAAGLGSAQTPAGYTKGLAAQQPFFYSNIAKALAQAYWEFDRLTGRQYNALQTDQAEKADYLLIAQGSAVETAKTSLESLQKSLKAQIGVVSIAQLRPFPGHLLSSVLKGKKGIAILERVDEPLAETLPLARELHAALHKATENGTARKDALPFPEYAVYEKGNDRPPLFSAMYLQDLTENALQLVVKNMLPNGDGRKRLYLGIRFKTAVLRSPKLEMLQQKLLRNYPEIEILTPGNAEESTQMIQPKNEPDTPWTVQRIKKPDGSVFDLARLWDSVGFLFETDEVGQALVDPFVATGVVPGRSSAFKKATAGSQRIIKLVPENLSEIDVPQLLAYAPEAGLQATVQGLTAILETAVRMCEARGHSFLQLPRLGANLLKIAYRMLVNDDLQKYCYAGPLFQDAFAELIEKMAPKDEQRSAFEQEIEPVLAMLASYIIVKTDLFFEQQHRQQKGSGLLLSLAINPDAAVDASACLSHMPANSMELVERSEYTLAEYRKNWQILNEMPDVEFELLEKWIDPSQPKTDFYYTFNRKVYHAMLLQVDDAPAFGARVAMRIVVAAIEAVMQPRYQALTQTISTLITRLEEKIQSGLSESLKINDFEAFGKRLSEQSSQSLDLSSVAALVNDEPDASQLDQQRLARLSQLRTTLTNLRSDFAVGANGDGRARMAAALSVQNPTTSFAVYPYNPFPFPWIQELESDAAAQATGLFVGLTNRMSETFKTIRMAELVLRDEYVPEKHDIAFKTFSWTDLDEQERQNCPPVLVITDEVTRFDPVSKLFQSGLPIKVLAINTRGAHLPDTTLLGTTEQHSEFSASLAHNEPGLTALLHRQSFVLQSSIGDPAHLFRGTMQGIRFAGPALLHVYAPDLRRQGASLSNLFELAELAVASRSFPIFNYEPDQDNHWGKCLSLGSNPETSQEWVMQPFHITQPSGFSESFPHQLTPADWAARQPEFEKSFKMLKPKEWHDAMIALSDYLVLPDDQREGREPYIPYVDQKTHIQRLVISTEIVKLVEERQQFWSFLRQLSHLESSIEQEISQQVQSRLEQEMETAKTQIAAEYQAKLTQLENQHDRLYHAKLTQKLLALSGFGQDSQKLRQSLLDFAATSEKTDHSEGNG